ncbi:MAG: tRNA (N6-isopentenyl adenosine(37)-C2)-methylthiotransferase MiaB [Proteobacteria bacterium]|nr:tRNA (N6-isopentenyl adenosine(37)-C2)-methylthiotransferase MiaB [Pseudomonadota bacterium]
MQIRIDHDSTAEQPFTADKKLFIKSYGCQMNVYDAQRMAELLAPHGYGLTDKPDGADMVILNTCHIREKAEEKVFSDLGRLREQVAEGALLAVGGCVGQAEGDAIIKRARYVDIVFGPQSYHRLPEMIARARRDSGGVVDTDLPELEKFDSLPAQTPTGAAAFVSIQEGCDKFCSFCVVPYTRGAEVSRPLNHVLDEVKRLADQGVMEVTLLGQNVNAYHGLDSAGQSASLARLMREIAKIDAIKRIRFTTSHPLEMTQDLIDVLGSEPKAMPYLHLPIQAGSDRILAAMNRRHTAQEYINIIDKVRAARPDIAISGDFIIGFPGETEQDYQDTLALVHAVGYAQSYSFAYSRRPGTPGAAMDEQVPENIKKERLAGLQALLEEQQTAYNNRFVGQVLEILVESKGGKDGQIRGRSPHNIAVNLEGNERLIGSLIRVNIVEARPRSLFGTVQLVAAS